MLKIDCYMSMECGSEAALRENVGAALLGEGVEAEVKYSRIGLIEAERRQLWGSPAVLVGGAQVEPAKMPGFG